MSETSFLLLNAATTHITRLKLLAIWSIGTLNFVLKKNSPPYNLYSCFRTFTYRSDPLFFRTVLLEAFTPIIISSFFRNGSRPCRSHSARSLPDIRRLLITYNPSEYDPFPNDAHISKMFWESIEYTARINVEFKVLGANNRYASHISEP